MHLRAAPLGAIGQVLPDLQKGVQNLLGIPKLLMMDTSKAVAQNRLTIKSVRQAWLTSTRKRTTTAGIISQAIEALAHPVPVQARPHDGPRYIMETDASDAAWGATVYRVTGARAPKEILAAALHWMPAGRQLHITTKEALVATYGLTPTRSAQPPFGQIQHRETSGPSAAPRGHACT